MLSSSHAPHIGRALSTVALSLQKAYRGWKGRERVSVILWAQFETAARTIQTAYRHWRDKKRVDANIVKQLDRKIFRKCKRNSPQVQRLKLKKDVENQPPTSVSFHKCLRGVTTHDGKMAIWRAMLELRRGHPYWSTHTAFKAMIEARGDLNRALTLLSDETFALKNEGDVPMQLQLLFIPSLPWIIPTAPSKGSVGPDGCATSPIAIASTLKSTQISQFGGTTTAAPSLTGLAGLRTMQGQRAAQGRPNALDYSQLFLRSYYSKYYAQNVHIGTMPCRKPQGFDPQTLTPKEPNADGSIQTWELDSAGRQSKTLSTLKLTSNFGAGQATPSRQTTNLPPSPILGERLTSRGQASLASPMGPHSFPLSARDGQGSARRGGTPDTTLLSDLIDLQRKMDQLAH